jgi:chromatin segregation and condensation protein Rec8/ScpA/Scc1 (kleisin family)
MNVSTLLNIQLPQFEGPLGLLLYLIRKEEMDIMNIQIHKITNQYMEYIKLMKELDLELAGEFVAMAATLIQIKSRMLLPQYNENGEVVENEDPRKELVQRLLEYQKYQEAARSLYERPLLGRDVWSRGLRERLDAKDEEIVLEENPVFALISAFQSAMRSVKKKVHMVAAKLQSVAGRILEIKDRLIVGQKIAMSDLINDENNPASTRKFMSKLKSRCRPMCFLKWKSTTIFIPMLPQLRSLKRPKHLRKLRKTGTIASKESSLTCRQRKSLSHLWR